MNISQHDEIVRWFQESFPQSYQFLREQFKESQGIYLVGGAVRDFFSKKTPNDLDLAIDNITSQDIVRIPGIEVVVFKDTVGGHVFRDGVVLDMWPLRETYGLPEFGLPISIEGVLLRAALNLDKIALELKTGTLYDAGGLEAMERREISYCPWKPFMEGIHAGRLILYEHKTGYSLAKSAVEHIRTVRESLNSETEEAIGQFIAKKYPDLVGLVIRRLRGVSP